MPPLDFRVRTVLLALALPVAAPAAQPLLPLPSARDWGAFAERPSLRAHEVPRLGNHATEFGDLRRDSLHAYDALRYDLRLELDFAQSRIHGVQRMRLRSREPQLEEIVLHLAGLTVDSLSVDGQPVSWQSVGDELRLDLSPQPLAEGDSAEVRVVYGGSPTTQTGVGLFFQSGRAWTLSDPWGTRFWAPCFDEPHDKAVWNLSVLCPDGLQVLANGTRIAVEPGGDGRTLWRFEHPVPMSSYLASLVAGPATLLEDDWNGLPLNWLVYPTHVEQAQLATSRVGAMFDCFTGLWGDYPFASYAMGEAPIYGGMGGMEHQTCTTIGSGIIAGGLTYESIVAHELAHQWWGDAVTPVDFRSVWLNEGWATYAEAFYYRHLAGDDEQAFLDYVRELQLTYLAWDAELLPIYDPPVDDLFNVSQYEKAACVLHMLRELLGRETFDQAQRDWLAAHLFGTVDGEDYRLHLEQASGQPLDWFFDQWIYTGGYPTWGAAVQTLPDGDGWRAHLSLTQDHPFLEDFRTPLPLRLESGGTVIDTVLWVEGSGASCDWWLVEPLDTLIVNAGHAILGRVLPVEAPGPLALRVLGFAIDDRDGGNGDGDLAPGESGRLALRLVNDGGWDLDLRFELVGDDLGLSGSWPDVPELGWGEELWLPAGPVSVTADGGPARWANLELRTTSQGGGLVTTALRLPVGDPRILFVDGDRDGRHARRYRDELDSLLAFSDEVWPDSLPEPVPGQDHDLVLWHTGNAGSALTEADFGWLSSWSAAGGAWLLSGQDALDSLAADDLEVLGLQVEELGGTVPSVAGLAAGPFAGLGGLLIGTGGAANQTRPDRISPTTGVWQAVAQYPGQGGPAGCWRLGGEAGGPALVLGFGMEALSGMAGTDSRRAWLDAALAGLLDGWTGLPPKAGNAPVAMKPARLELLGVAPNPFNPSTSLHVRLREPCRLRLQVHDLLGRTVLDEDLGWRPAGEIRQVIDLGDSASGLYIYSVQAGTAVVVGRLLLLR